MTPLFGLQWISSVNLVTLLFYGTHWLATSISRGMFVSATWGRRFGGGLTNYKTNSPSKDQFRGESYYQLDSQQTELRSCCRAAARWRRDDIAVMLVVAIETINAYRNLVIRIFRTARGMTDRDLAATGQTCRAAFLL
jgi:hypothetical protein